MTKIEYAAFVIVTLGLLYWGYRICLKIEKALGLDEREFGFDQSDADRFE